MTVASIINSPIRNFSTEITTRNSVFLAGNFEKYYSKGWQNTAKDYFLNLCDIIYDPRRKLWYDNNIVELPYAEVSDQVDWEISKMLMSRYIFFSFGPSTKASRALALLMYALAEPNIDKDNIVVACDVDYPHLDLIVSYCRYAKVSTDHVFNDALEMMGTKMVEYANPNDIKIASEDHREIVRNNKLRRERDEL